MLAAPTAAGNLDDMDLDAELDQLMDMDNEPPQRRTTSSVVAAQAFSRGEAVVQPVNSMREEIEASTEAREEAS